jgi:DNA-binding NtrC family response regulator
VAEGKVLVVEDEEGVRLPLRRFLTGMGYEIVEAGSLSSALDAVRKQSMDAAIVDFSLPDGDGLDVLRALKAQDPSLPVVLLTAHGTIDLAVRAIKEGANHFLTKPVELKALAVVLERDLEARRLRRVALVGKSAQSRRAVDPFFG